MKAARRQEGSLLSRERLISTALELIDAEGVDKLTVRRVASALAVTPMALYWHFANKDGLLDGIGDALAQRLELPVFEPQAPWDKRLAVLMSRLIDAFAEHPGAAEIAMRRLLYTETGRAFAELGLAVLNDAGLSDDDAVLIGRYALRTALSVATEEVFTGAEVSSRRSERLQQEFDAQLEAAPEAAFPLLRRMRAQTSRASEVNRYREVAVEIFVNGVRHFCI